MPWVRTSEPPHGTGLVLAPFRGVRFAADRVGDLAAVTSPPYDVLDGEAVAALEAADPHNVVRLTLPHDDAGDPDSRYRRAALTLREWLSAGVLVADPVPALYVYDQTRDGEILLRGLLGALALRDPAQRTVLPHEQVMPGPVADRLALMRATEANVEPIFCVYDGGGVTGDVVAGATSAPPVVSVTTADGLTHRIWPISDPATLDAVAGDLWPRRALIVDGHHRYTAYRALQAERHADGAGPGPWDLGLTLLVDLRAFPPAIGAIHRSVAGLGLDDAVTRAAPLFTARPLAGPEQAAADLRRGRLVVTDGDRTVELAAADPQAVDAALPQQHPPAWRRLDTAVLHHALIADRWSVDDARVTYHHDLEGAIRAARRGQGVAVLVPAVAVEEVLELAAAGESMPRKSTSFGPKPRTGLVLRTFAAG